MKQEIKVKSLDEFGSLFVHVVSPSDSNVVVQLINRSDKPVRELVADSFTVSNIRRELDGILPGGAGRQAMMDGYDEVKRLLGDSDAPGNAARIMVELLGRVQPHL